MPAQGQLLDGAFKGAIFAIATIGAAAGGGLAPAVVLAIGLGGLGAIGLAQAVRIFMALKSSCETNSVSALVISSPLLGALILCGLFLLMAYLLPAERAGVFTSAIVAACMFFAIGALKSGETAAERWRNGLNTFVLGMVVGASAFGVGHTVNLMHATSLG